METILGIPQNIQSLDDGYGDRGEEWQMARGQALKGNPSS